MKILYAVQGDGKGHAVRSSVVLNYLKNRHQIILAANNDAYDYFKKKNKPVVHLKGLRLSYNNNKVDLIPTFMHYIKDRKKVIKYNWRKLSNIIKQNKPDVIISDFEPTSFKIAKKYNIPIISFDNQNIITNAEIDVPLSNTISYFLSKKVISDWSKDADFYIISSFFSPNLKVPNSVIVPPVLRDALYSFIPEKKDFVLVYQTSNKNKHLLKILRSINANFVIYGWDMDKNVGNLVFKKFDEYHFLKDLSSCKAVITNGGFTAITEALHFKKPILSIPIKHQFEQIVNALHLDRLGFGEYLDKIDRKRIADFVKNPAPYEINLFRYEPKTNHYAFGVFDYLLEIIHKRKQKQN